MKFTCYTLGCKVNQYETQAMEQQLAALGHTLCQNDESCDAIIINTCTVTATGDRKSRSMVRRARRLNPDAAVGICGCYAQVSPGEAAALEADVVSGTGDRLGFLEALERAAAARMAGLTPAQAVRVDPARKRGGFEVLPAGGLAARTRAITELLRSAGPKHAMFGTDMPILRMRTHRIEENGTYINLVPPGLYGDPGQDPHLREVSAEEAEHITFFAYEELLAFKRACKTLGLSRQDVEDIMYNNAVNLIEGARKSIYGGKA